MKLLFVAGARPNFPKVAPLIRSSARLDPGGERILVHTGQHYDYNMSKIFFEELDLPIPDDFLNVGGGTHAEQTARVMLAFEPVLQKHAPDWLVVVGDVNSTLACALVGAKLGVRVAHVEAGLRSRDRSMPEEINRLLTDQLSDLLFTPSPDGDENLQDEGIPAHKIHCVGNVMIDTLVEMLPRAMARPVLGELGLQAGKYVLATLHRPSNVDRPETLSELLGGLNDIATRIPVIFPVHPRTRKNIEGLVGLALAPGVHLIEPLGYLDFLSLTRSAALVLTDSGGVQEETTYLGVPCLTARPNTERPVTITQGTNRLVASRRSELLQAALEALEGKRAGDHSVFHPPERWDGHAAERIIRILLQAI